MDRRENPKPMTSAATGSQSASERIIHRHHVATWGYRLLPVAAAGLPFALAGGALHPAVAITVAVLGIASLLYAKVKLHGRVDEIRLPGGPVAETLQAPETKVRVRLPGLLATRWRALPAAAFADARLEAVSVRNAASAFRLEVGTDRETLRVPLNGAALDLDALQALCPKPIARFREATAHMRVHFDLAART